MAIAIKVQVEAIIVLLLGLEDNTLQYLQSILLCPFCPPFRINAEHQVDLNNLQYMIFNRFHS